MEITPEIQTSIDRFRDAIEKAKLKLDSVPPEARERLQLKYEKFRKQVADQMTDSEILRMLCMADVITPRESVHSWDYPLRPGERDDSH